MTFFWYARCDNPACGDVLQGDSEDELLEQAWLRVEVGDSELDFCSLPCLTSWSGSGDAVRLAAEAVEARVAEPEEDDE